MKKIILGLVGILCLSGAFVAPINTHAVETTPSRLGCFKFTENLRFGDGYYNQKGGKVLELQETLKTAGYFHLTPTGYFGLVTFRAVKSYQKNYSIPQTGFAGELTRGSLRSNFCTGTIPPDPNIPPANCQNWYDGCNSCSRTSPKGPMMCTMMACMSTMNPPYCRAYFDGSIQACPTEKITDNMPIVCVTTPCEPVNKSYYIYEGTRHKLSEFDTVWVAEHCSVKESIVY